MESVATSKIRFVERFDWSFAGLVLLLSILGLMTLYSSVYHSNIEIFYKQLMYMGGGFIFALAVGWIDYRVWNYLAWPFYIVVLCLLVLVAIVGHASSGAQRWLDFGVIFLQPSELIKLALVFILARFFSRDKAAPLEGYRLRDLWFPLLLASVPMGLVFMQPDLGTTTMIAFVAFSVIFFAQLRLKSLMILLLGFTVAVPLCYQFVLQDYQKERVLTFLEPQRDPLGDGYHSLQSMIAVGSGQAFGKGYLQGTQSKLEFLPKHHTDFIFSAFAEEWGFVGSLFVLALFCLFVLLGVDIVRKAKDRFGSILAMGCLSLVIWHAIVNIGMEIGLLPVVGVTLPFFSYGGSSTLTNMFAVGVLLSVSFRRHFF